MTQESAPLTRERLYELVWQEPMLKVAARYGVPSMYMTRVCVELRVPRPATGHWSKVEHGKAPPRPPLPPTRDGDLTEWRPGTTFATPPAPVARRPRRARTDAADDPTQPVVATSVPPRATRHALLIGARAHFLKTRTTRDGLLRPFKRRLVDIVTSEKALDAALEAANTLFRALAKKGYTVTEGAGWAHRAEVDEREVPNRQRYHYAVWSPDRATVTTIGEVEFGLTLFEMTESVESVYVGNSKYIPVRDLTAAQLARLKEPNHWRSREDLPSGRFGLQAYVRGRRLTLVKRWQETKAGEFASMVPKVIAELEGSTADILRKHEEATRKAEEEHRRWLEERRLAEEAAERARRAKNVQDAKADLLAAIASWEQSRSIHAYFMAAERELEGLAEAERVHLRGRLSEARTLVGDLDALEKLKAWRTPLER